MSDQTYYTNLSDDANEGIATVSVRQNDYHHKVTVVAGDQFEIFTGVRSDEIDDFASDIIKGLEEDGWFVIVSVL